MRRRGTDESQGSQQTNQNLLPPSKGMQAAGSRSVRGGSSPPGSVGLEERFREKGEGAVVLPKEFTDEMKDHALDEHPNETCGLTASRRGRVVKLWRCLNKRASPYRFEIDPEDVARVFAESDSANWEVSGVYWSRTQTEPRPTPLDERSAIQTMPEAFYVITSLKELPKGEPEQRAFRQKERAPYEVMVRPTSQPLNEAPASFDPAEWRRYLRLTFLNAFPIVDPTFGRSSDNRAIYHRAVLDCSLEKGRQWWNALPNSEVELALSEDVTLEGRVAFPKGAALSKRTVDSLRKVPSRIKVAAMWIEEPPSGEIECLKAGLSFSAPVKIMGELRINETGEVKLETVELGRLPMVTQRGTFISRGREVEGQSIRMKVTQWVASEAGRVTLIAARRLTRNDPATLTPKDLIDPINWNNFDLGSGDDPGGDSSTPPAPLPKAPLSLPPVRDL